MHARVHVLAALHFAKVGGPPCLPRVNWDAAGALNRAMHAPAYASLHAYGTACLYRIGLLHQRCCIHPPSQDELLTKYCDMKRTTGQPCVASA